MPFDSEHRAAEAAALAAAAFIRSHAGGLSMRRPPRQGRPRPRVVRRRGRAADRPRRARARRSPTTRSWARRGRTRAPTSTAAASGSSTPSTGRPTSSHNVPPYAVSIGLRVDGVGEVGVVLDVASGELFSATRGAGLTVDGAPASVSDTARLDDALIATGFPYRDFRCDGRLPRDGRGADALDARAPPPRRRRRRPRVDGGRAGSTGSSRPASRRGTWPRAPCWSRPPAGRSPASGTAPTP